MSRVVIIGGAGRVGLPLGAALAKRHKVKLLDLDEPALGKVAMGLAPFKELGLAELIREHRANLETEGVWAGRYDVAGAAHVVLTVGTPLGADLESELSGLESVIEKLKPQVAQEQHVCVRSTIPPGITRWVARQLPEAIVTCCPERIVEGQAVKELHTLPQLVGCRDIAGFAKAKELFAPLGVPLVRVTPEEAELAKLFSNAHRYISFAVANQLWQTASRLGVDYRKVWAAMREKYPRASDLPRPGFASGPCLYKDTMVLGHTLGSFSLGDAAMRANEGLPRYIVNQLKLHLNGLGNYTIGLLGVAFKAESDDTRNSLAVRLWRLLEREGAIVKACDPFVRDGELVSLREVERTSDFLILGAPHRAYLQRKFSRSLFDPSGLHPQGVLP